MASYLIVPDIHGRTEWLEPATAHVEAGNPVAMLGDYVDAFGVSDEQMLGNFTDVILLKMKYPELVTLLLGNHCFPYISPMYSCSGNRKSIWLALNSLYKDNLHLFQMAKQVGDTLFVHAGLTAGWLNYNRIPIERCIGRTIEKFSQVYGYAYLLNMLFEKGERSMLYHVSKVHGGWDYYDGPLWVRPSQLLNDALPGLHQVVGHTHMPNVVTEGSLYTTGTITFTDCMGNADWQPLILEL